MKVGILGNGQLGQMLQASVEDIADIAIELYDLRAHSPEALSAFIARQDRLTFETENISADIVQALEPHAGKLYPKLTSLKTFQHRIQEKNALQQAGIATAPFRAVNALEDIASAVDELGLPIILKTTTEGYDGKGQFVLRNPEQIQEAWDSIGGRELIAEGFVNFSCELSIIAARDENGHIETWAMTENRHHEGILRCSLYPPAQLTKAMQDQALAYIKDLARSQDYTGTITLELFATDEGLVANEVAPRVHNSGHWTIEGCRASQFRNHMLAITGRALEASTPNYDACAMLNVISSEEAVNKAPATPNAFVHSYHKEAREKRKLGHVTVCGNSITERDSLIDAFAFLLPHRSLL